MGAWKSNVKCQHEKLKKKLSKSKGPPAQLPPHINAPMLPRSRAATAATAPSCSEGVRCSAPDRLIARKPSDMYANVSGGGAAVGGAGAGCPSRELMEGRGG